MKREEVDRRVKEVEETYSDRFTHQARYLPSTYNTLHPPLLLSLGFVVGVGTT